MVALGHYAFASAGSARFYRNLIEILSLTITWGKLSLNLTLGEVVEAIGQAVRSLRG
jgi:hypothetical protein